jgi:dethiobiotin synthetase
VSAIFITGTGTDIGKTYLTKGLVSALRSRERPVLAIKPVVSGFDPNNPIGSDPAVLLEAMERALCWEELERISPFRFFAPLSPDMAARIENKKIDFSDVCNFFQEAIRAYEGAVLIEGIGGIIVPLSKTKTTLDLMIDLNLPLILVAGTYLGSISHLLSALEVIHHKRLVPLAVVINETAGSTVPAAELLETLRDFISSPLFPLHTNNAAHNRKIFEQLLDLAQL